MTSKDACCVVTFFKHEIPPIHALHAQAAIIFIAFMTIGDTKKTGHRMLYSGRASGDRFFYNARTAVTAALALSPYSLTPVM